MHPVIDGNVQVSQPSCIFGIVQFLSQGAILFDFFIKAADGISRTETATPTLLTMPGGDEEEARVEEDVKNEEERRWIVREYVETNQWLLQLQKGHFRAIWTKEIWHE